MPRRPLPKLVFPSEHETPLDDSRIRKAIVAIVTKAEAQSWLATRVVAAVHDELILEAPADERADIAAGILQHEMRAALLEIYPESAAMGADRLAEAEVLTSWAEKG